MNVSHIIERLEDAIQVCYDVGKGYPYATGYAQVTMKETIWMLKELMNEED